MFLRSILLAVLFGFVLGSPVPSFGDEKGQLLNEPVYFPHTKSYFELKQIPEGHPAWPVHKRYAESKRYKGAKGRLAIIRDKQTHEFVTSTFQPADPVWIGLRFFCRFRKLVWVNGEIHPLKDFKIWHKQWYRNKQTLCESWHGPNGYMPVYYTKTKSGYAWQASGPGKGFTLMLIEYPTGKE